MNQVVVYKTPLSRVFSGCMKATKDCSTSARNCSTCCTSTDVAATTRVEVPAYERELEAPPTQMKVKQSDLPIQKFRHPHAAHLKTEQKRNLLAKPCIPHGVVCDGIVKQARIDNDGPSPGYDPADFKPGQSVFLNCGSGDLSRNDCSQKLQDRIEELNATRDFKFKLNKSGLEKNGLQARFCLPYNNGTLDVLVWAKFNKDTQKLNVLNVLLLNYVFYGERKQVLPRVKASMSDIVKTLPNLSSIPKNKWRIISNHHFDHPIGQNDITHIGV